MKVEINFWVLQLLWSLKKHGFQWKDVFISYKVKLSSKAKNIIKTFKHNYNRKVLIDELSRILMYQRGEEKGQLNYTQLLGKIYVDTKKEQ